MSEEIENTASGVENIADSEVAVHDQNVDLQSQSQGQKEEFVPVSALKAEREQRQQLQEDVRMMRQNIDLINSNRPISEQQPNNSAFGDLKDDDIMTVADFKKAANDFKSQINNSLSEVKVHQNHNDLNKTLTKYLPGVLKKNLI